MDFGRQDESAARPEAVEGAVRIVLHDMKNQLGVALGAFALVRDHGSNDELGGEFEMGLSSLQQLDHAVTLLQNMTRGRVEETVDFEFFAFLTEFAKRAERLPAPGGDVAASLRALAAEREVAHVRAPRGALYDLFAKCFFAPPGAALRLLSVEVRAHRDDPVLRDGSYVSCRLAAGSVNIESDVLGELVTLRIRGCDFGRVEGGGDTWFLRLPLVGSTA